MGRGGKKLAVVNNIVYSRERSEVQGKKKRVTGGWMRRDAEEFYCLTSERKELTRATQEAQTDNKEKGTEKKNSSKGKERETSSFTSEDERKTTVLVARPATKWGGWE